MECFDTRLANGTFAVEGRNGWIVVRPIEEIVGALGEVYEVEYDERQATMPWLGTDDGVLRIEVRETLAELSFDEVFVVRLSTTPRERRVGTFTNVLRRIWDTKGNLEAG